MTGQFWNWSATAADNDDADNTINWLEGQSAASVNNSSRAEMAAVASLLDDLSGQTVTGGSANAHTYASAVSFSALANGMMFRFRAGFTNSGAATLNITPSGGAALGATAIVGATGSALTGGEIQAGGIYTVTYVSASTHFRLHAATHTGGPLSATTIAGTTATLTTSSGSALSVGRQGATNPAFTVNASIASCVTGLAIVSQSSGNGTYVSAVSSSANEPLIIDALGSGALILNANATGSILLGDNVTVSQAGAITAATVAGGIVATQAQQETGTAVDVVVTPGRQHFHPSACKAWAKINTNGALSASYNVTSVTDNGTGDFTVNIANDFSSGEYVGVGNSGGTTGGVAITVVVDGQAAGTFEVGLQKDDGTKIDPTTPAVFYMAFFGDL